MFVGGELVVCAVEIVLILLNKGREVDLEREWGVSYFCSLTTTVWSWAMLTISVSPRASSFLLSGRLRTSTLILGVLLYCI